MMPLPNCHLCAEPLDGAIARVTFEGFETLALNGVTFTVHARCLRFEPTSRVTIEPLPPRISDPVAEPDLVTIEDTDWGDWRATCRECGAVALKPVKDDAHLAAAYHLARRHAELAA